jgi:hypothetical protein
VYHSTVRQPAIRLSVARDSIEFLERFRPGGREQLLAGMPAETREFIENAAGSGWLPIEHDRHVLRGHIALLGMDECRRCWRDGMAELSRKPLLSSVVSGMMRVFRQDKTKLLGVVPRGWSLVYRDFCRIEISEKRAGEVTFVCHDIAPQVWEDPEYIDCWGAVLLGLLDLAKTSGELEIEQHPELARARIRISWNA